MPLSKPGKLSRETIADILAYVLNANRFPDGTTELPKRTEMLNQIRIEETKPDRGEKKLAADERRSTRIP